MTTYTWKIESITSYQNYNGISDVVFKALWRCIAEDVDGENRYIADFTSLSYINIAADPTFTPYDQLNEDQIINWLWSNGVVKTDVETSLANEITAQKSGIAITTKIKPW